MGRVTIDQIAGKPVTGRPARKVPIWRVRLDQALVGYLFQDDPIKGRVHFCAAGLSQDEMEVVRNEVAENLGTKPCSTDSAPIMPEQPEEMPDYGDF